MANGADAVHLTDPQSVYADRRTTVGNFNMDGQPVILAGGQINWAATNWLRHLRETGRAESSIETYRAVLQDFLIAVYDSGLTWDQVDDTFLEKWRSYLLEDRGIKKSTFNSYLDIVIRWYRWAQEVTWVDSIIGVGRSPNGLRYPISLVENSFGPKALVSSQKFNTTRETLTAIPSPQVLEDINCEIATGRKDERLNERDLIVVELCRGPGLRRSEALRLKCRQIPKLKVIEAMLDASQESVDPFDGLGYRLVIQRSKRGGQRAIYLPLELLRRMREWIDGPRRTLLTRMIERGTIHRRPEAIFISRKTGAALSGPSVTNMYTIARAKAASRSAARGKVVRSPVPHDKARLHHLRHVAITDQYVARIEAGQDKTLALVLAGEFAGHRPGSKATEIYMHIGDRLLPEMMAAEQQVAAQQEQAIRMRRVVDAARIAGGSELIDIHTELGAAVRDGLVTIDDVRSFLGTKASP